MVSVLRMPLMVAIRTIVFCLLPFHLNFVSLTKPTENNFVFVDAYITHSALPERRQVEWLKEMTWEVCESPPGELSDEMLQKTPYIIQGWVTISKNKDNLNNKKKKKKKKKKQPKANNNNDEDSSSNKYDNSSTGISRNSNSNSHQIDSMNGEGIESVKAVESLFKRYIKEERIATVQDYNCLLEVWARSGAGEAAAERCEQILTEMQQRYQNQGGDNVKPNLESFKAVLMAWKNAIKDDNLAHKNNIIKDNNNNNNNNNKKKEGSHSICAQRILEWMVYLYEEGHNDLALPDADCFDTVLQVLSHSGNEDAPNKAEQLLQTMERLYQATGNEKIKPRTSSFNSVLSAWGKTSLSSSSSPSVSSNKNKRNNSYNKNKKTATSISAGTGTGNMLLQTEAARAAADRALELLAFMEHLANEGDSGVLPDLASYTIVVAALARLGDDDSNKKAEALLERVIYIYTTKDDDMSDLIPNTSLFNIVMGGLSKSKNDKISSFMRTRAILDCQIDLYKRGCLKCCPDVFGFTSVINSCANNMGKRNNNYPHHQNAAGSKKKYCHETKKRRQQRFEAFNIALETYEQLREYDRPNHVTYGSMLKACNLLLDKNSVIQKRLVRKILNSCIEDDCVGNYVMNQLRDINPLLLRKTKQQQQQRQQQLQQKYERKIEEQRMSGDNNNGNVKTTNAKKDTNE